MNCRSRKTAEKAQPHQDTVSRFVLATFYEIRQALPGQSQYAQLSAITGQAADSKKRRLTSRSRQVWTGYLYPTPNFIQNPCRLGRSAEIP